MPNVRVAPIEVAPEPEDSGARLVTALIPGFGNVDIVFSEAEAVQLVQIFQKGFLDRIEKRDVTPNYPAISILDVDIAHGEQMSGVLLQTAEIGSMVATFAPPLQDKLINEIKRASEANVAREKAN